MKRRLRIVNDFNTDKTIFALLLTKRIGGTGLNITGADRVLIFDADMNGMDGDRGRDRAWRIGQVHDVVAYRLVLAGTLEEKLYKRGLRKGGLAEKALGEAQL